MSPRWALLLLVAALYSGWNYLSNRPVRVTTAGMLAPQAPQQENLPAALAPVFQHKGFRIEAQASYQLQARLLAKESYRFDRESKLSPVDFALGWGPMSDSRLLEQISIKQSNRFYWLRWQNPDLSSSLIMENSANTHLIPSSTVVARQLKAMRPGQLIELHGYLVNAVSPKGWHWQSSLSRTDTGAGACELFWVESARVVR